ncbi:MAG: 2,3-bisphosphoglycerate-independent phosphoglycerate mutase [Desulfobacteraceae bacterium]|nr:2,3-bisphosphoglycerate-independent phosphoglycerate mutase [Desulfobacteraceae bacterium]
MLLDGLGDRSYEQLMNQTPLQAAQTPVLDRLAAMGANGLYHAGKLGQAMPSENAHFTMFGYDMEEFPGRGALEALGAGIDLKPEDVAILAHFACVAEEKGCLVLKKNKPLFDDNEALELVNSLGEFETNGLTVRFHHTHGLNGILVFSGKASPFITDTGPFTDSLPLSEAKPWLKYNDDLAAINTANALKAYLLRVYEQLKNHPVNMARLKKGLPPINGIVTQRAGKLKIVTPFPKRYGLCGVSIASGLVYAGLSAYIGLDFRRVKDSGDPGKDFADRLAMASDLMKLYDFIHVHTKTPDEAAHTKDPILKKTVIESLDKGIGEAIGPFLDDPEVIVIVTADHSTPSSGLLIHSGEPVPLTICGPGVRCDSVKQFDEVSAGAGAIGCARGKELMYMVLNHLDIAKLQGIMDTPADQPFYPGNYEPFHIPAPEIETGVIHGRFQVLHNDHIKYLMAGKRLCRHLVIGITNPDPTMTKDDNADPGRSGALANPLNYYERYTLIRTALEEAGLKPGQFSIVPLPINFPELYQYYVPMDAVFFLTIYDEWGRKKQSYFELLGLKTHVLWEVPPEKKGISANEVRNRMIQRRPWEHMVPVSVADFMRKWNIPGRLKEIQEGFDVGQSKKPGFLEKPGF